MASELGHELLPLEEVRSEILALVDPLPVESCPIGVAHHRVLREDIQAVDDIPPFDNSAMDGYAVCARDLEGAAPGEEVLLPVVTTLAAGTFPAKPLEMGTVFKIMTGAPIPRGADAVVPWELTRAEGDRVAFQAAVEIGKNIRRAGSDVQVGDVPLHAGVWLRGPQLAMAASLGRAVLQTTRRPRVAIMSPGDELVEPGQPLGPGQIRSANQYALMGFLEEMGVEPLPLGIVPDRRDEIRATLRRAAEEGADAVISTGGVSAGDYDFVQGIAREEGNPGRVYKVAMRPGKPQAFALIDGIPLFGLPGNPAAAIISFVVLVRPALKRLLGLAEVLSRPFPVRFPKTYRYKPGRTFFLRARVEPEPGEGAAGFQVVDVGEQDSSFLASLTRANALVVLPADRDVAREGEIFPAEWIHE